MVVVCYNACQCPCGFTSNGNRFHGSDWRVHFVPDTTSGNFGRLFGNFDGRPEFWDEAATLSTRSIVLNELV